MRPEKRKSANKQKNANSNWIRHSTSTHIAPKTYDELFSYEQEKRPRSNSVTNAHRKTHMRIDMLNFLSILVFCRRSFCLVWRRAEKNESEWTNDECLINYGRRCLWIKWNMDIWQIDTFAYQTTMTKPKWTSVIFFLPRSFRFVFWEYKINDLFTCPKVRFLHRILFGFTLSCSLHLSSMETMIFSRSFVDSYFWMKTQNKIERHFELIVHLSFKKYDILVYLWKCHNRHYIVLSKFADCEILCVASFIFVTAHTKSHLSIVIWTIPINHFRSHFSRITK